MTAAANQRLLSSLEEAGFFEGLEPAVAAELKAGIAEHGYAGVFDHPWRVYFADDAEIAKGGAAEFLTLVATGLEAVGVPPLIGEEAFDQETLSEIIIIGGETFLLLTDVEYEQEENGERPLQRWGLIPARLHQLLNEHLARHGKADRFYASLIGNDASAFLLTPAMFEAISIWFKAADPRWPNPEMPYFRTEHYPDFGQPGIATE